MILITGNLGFIGGNFAKTITNPAAYYIPRWDVNLALVPWKEIHHVYHFGAISSTTETDIDLIYNANIRFTIDLFNYCADYGIPITYASSASVYGNSDTYDINPLNYYALSKATIDYKAKEMIDDGIDIVGLRFYNVYGDGEDSKRNQASPITQFTKQAQQTGIIKVYEGSEFYYRDFVWVQDVIDCCHIQALPGIYDVGTSEPLSFMEVAEMVADKYNAKIEVIDFPDHLEGKYQTHTCAQEHFEKSFTSVAAYLKFHLS